MTWTGLLPTPTEGGGRDTYYTVPPSVGKTRGFSLGMKLAEISLTSSPAPLPVNPSPAPEREKDQAMTVTSGLRCLQSFGRLPRAGLWQRMFLDCLVRKGGWYSRVCALTWKLRATKSSRLYFQLAAKTLPTDGTGFGSWQDGLLRTPDASVVTGGGAKVEDRKRQGHAIGLHDQVRSMGMLATPNAADCTGTHGGGQGRSLRTDIHDINKAMLPTPACRDYKGANSKEHTEKGRGHMCQLPNVMAHGTNTGAPLRLEPAFALWMMGYPEDWLDLEDGE
jgi:hypothetical protein